MLSERTGRARLVSPPPRLRRGERGRGEGVRISRGIIKFNVASLSPPLSPRKTGGRGGRSRYRCRFQSSARYVAGRRTIGSANSTANTTYGVRTSAAGTVHTRTPINTAATSNQPATPRTAVRCRTKPRRTTSRSAQQAATRRAIITTPSTHGAHGVEKVAGRRMMERQDRDHDQEDPHGDGRQRHDGSDPDAPRQREVKPVDLPFPGPHDRQNRRPPRGTDRGSCSMQARPDTSPVSTIQEPRSDRTPAERRRTTSA